MNRIFSTVDAAMLPIQGMLPHPQGSRMSPAVIASKPATIPPQTVPFAAQPEDPRDDDGDDCPVICADEVFLGSSERNGLRVVCFSTSANSRWLRRKVS